MYRVTKETNEIIFNLGVLVNIQDEFQNHENTQGIPFNRAVLRLRDSANSIASTARIDPEILASKNKKNID